MNKEFIFENDMSLQIFKSKYMLANETKPEQAVQRVLKIVKRYYPDQCKLLEEAIIKKWVGLAGGIWRSAGNPNKNVSAINCTTLDQPEDNLESINEAWYWWAKFAAYGQGEGVDLSKLRPRGSKLHNSANESSGSVSFMHTFDGILNIIAQQGRRGASLISLNIKHPDIPEFITVKDKEGILETANISIHITDDFMKAVENNDDWFFEFSNKYETIKKKTSAKELFKFISEHAWKSGDPGVQFIDTMHRYSNSDYLGYPVVSTNACSEQVLDPHNVCLLSSINLAKYYEYGKETFIKLIHAMVYLLDAFRLYEIEENRSPSPLQIEKLKKLPRIGLGVTGYADYLTHKKVVYGSEESILDAKQLFGTLSGEAYKASYEIAKKNGTSFEYYDKNKYKKSPFVKTLLKDGFIEDKDLDYQAHVCKTTIAPTGSLTMIVEAGGGGIEPIFAKYYVRRERSTTGNWKEWFTYNDLVRKEIENQNLELTRENVEKVTTDPWWVTAHTVDNMAKIKLMSVIQKYTDSAISVTYNLPNDAKPEDIEKIYWEAWKHDLKAVSVFRDGSKLGVLITDANYESSSQNNLKLETSNNRYSVKRPEIVECDIYQVKVNGTSQIVLVGLVEDEPYEIFATGNEDNIIKLGNYKKGFIKKIKKGHYDLIVQNGEEKVIIEDLRSTFNIDYGSLSRFISMGLRHRVPIEFIVDQLAKDKNFAGFEKSVSRVLKKYIKEEEPVKTSEVCPQCGSALIYKEGCKSCTNETCGWSKCD